MDEIFEDIRNLTPGKCYKISLHDCCIEGSVQGVYERFDEQEDQYIFDTCVIGPGWGQWTAREVKEGKP